jgi:ParB/RepB/Spo0J family partition protein
MTEGDAVSDTPEEPDLVSRAVGMRNLLTEELHANPHNPRMLFDPEPMLVLRESIRKVGILVPLTVYQDSKRKRVVILDGQRRWMCAKDIGLKRVPVNLVQEPTLVQNIVTMFQIHKLREDWELMPTALKVEVLMREMKEKRDDKLAILTGLDRAVIARCKKLLSFPRKYQDMMLDPDPTQRVKADFFIELYAVRNDRNVQKMSWFHRDGFTEAMLSRYQAKKLKAVTDFRKIKEHITNAHDAHKNVLISRRLREFSEDADLGIEHLDIASAKAVKAAKALLKQTNKLAAEISIIDAEQFLGEEDLWRALEALAATIRTKLQEAGRRLRG